MSRPARRNVWERHLRALYINVPVSADVAASLAMPQCGVEPSIYKDESWVSVVVDDLDTLHFYVGAGLFAPTGMSGWMTKVVIKSGHLDI